MPRIDVLPTGTSLAQPGYAFVPDTRQASQAVPQPSAGRKRAARNTGTGVGDATVRQQNVVQKHIEELHRENTRDVQIHIPKEATGKAATKAKTTPNVRRIMMSQKNFSNHLADEEAALAQKSMSTSQTPTTLRRMSTVEPRSAGGHKIPESSSDPLEDEPLLRTYGPTVPSDEVMQALVTAPPLPYKAALATPSASGKPQRFFCEICGYWGQIKCLKCGARICGLECKGAHDEGRCLKFYA